MAFIRSHSSSNSCSVEHTFFSLSLVRVDADSDADEQKEESWREARRKDRLGRDGANAGVCTNYTDNYCAALIKRRQQIRLLLVPNFAAR